jgi:hypothetical protein
VTEVLKTAAQYPIDARVEGSVAEVRLPTEMGRNVEYPRGTKYKRAQNTGCGRSEPDYNPEQMTAFGKSNGRDQVILQDRQEWVVTYDRSQNRSCRSKYWGLPEQSP